MQNRLQVAKSVQPTHPDCSSRLEQIDKKKKEKLNVTACGEQIKSTRVNCDCTKARKVTAPKSLKNIMEKEVQLSLGYGAIRKMPVLTDPDSV